MQWRDIKGYEGRYQVSDTGLVKSCEHTHNVVIRGIQTTRHRKEQMLKQWKRSRYLLVDLWKDGARDVRSVHVLVYEAFKGNIPENYIIHHIDSNKFNNCIDNLQLISYKEHNRIHHTGRIPWNKGKKCPENAIKAWITRRRNNARRMGEVSAEAKPNT